MIGWLIAAAALAALQAWTGWWGWVAGVPFVWAWTCRPRPLPATGGGAALGAGVWLAAAAVAWSTGSADGVRRVADLLGPLTGGTPAGLFVLTAAAGAAVAGTAALAGALVRTRPDGGRT